MFAQKGDYDSESRLDCGPAAAREGKVPSLDLLLANETNHHSMDTCTENPVSVLSSDLHTVPYNHESDGYQTYIKNDSETKLNEEDDIEDAEHCDSVSNLLSIEDRALELHTKTQNGELQPMAEDTSESMETSTMLSSVPHFAQNFTLNVSSGAGNIAAIQNVVQSVSSGNQTLWLPTIISSTTTSNNDDQCEMEETSTTTSMPQIILAGTGQHYTTHPMSNPLLSSSDSCRIALNHKYPPKVQILSSITIPKHGAISSNMKGVIHTSYLNPNEIKLNSPVPQQPKQLLNNSVLNSQLSNKGSPASVARGSTTKGPSVMNSANLQLKNVANVSSRPSTKIGNNTLPISNQQSHVLSRVVPGPKMSLQSVGRGLKTRTNSFQYSQKVTGPFPNLLASQNVQASPVKIIQQHTNSKGGLKTLPPSRAGVGTKGVNCLQGKSWSAAGNLNESGTPKHAKNVSGVGLHKLGSKSSARRLVLQPTPNSIITSGSPNNRSNAQYVQQSNDSIQSLNFDRFTKEELKHNQHVSSNQNLTAQILQSLSHPKSMHAKPFQQSAKPQQSKENINRIGQEQSRQIHGDPTTLLISDDILGTEERPDLSNDSLSYPYYPLQLVMLDHTYAGTPQVAPSVASSTSQVISTSPVHNTAQISPVNASSPPKATPISLSSPINSVLPNQLSPVQAVGAPSTNCSNTVQSNYQYGSLLHGDDDDAASVISSIDGDERRANERNGSDTETAPEGEEEGKTRCVCDFVHDDGYMICCDRCGEWQHVDCMGIDRLNIPDDYMCEKCQPRLVDRRRARSIQMRKREEITGLGSSGSESSGGSSKLNPNRRPAPGGSHKKRPLTVTTYSNTVGGVSRAVPVLPSQPPAYLAALPGSGSVPPVPTTNPKRGPKRPRRVDNGRKGPKRKIPDKRMKRKSDVVKYRNKYFAPPNPSQQQNQWNESYESAMTNHYSPELRAKIARNYSNKSATNPSTMAVVLTAHHCTTVPHAGGKILIATKDLKENTPIIELRGKYMLSAQHRPQPPMGRAGSQRPGPYLFFYRFPKDSTQVCIDTRTYGNEARFVRRSCKPNAELQHCIIKGALHVYLVTINGIQSNTEISIRHESSGSWQTCACGNPKHCKQIMAGTALSHRNNGASSERSARERRGRTRHTSSSSHFSSLTTSSSSVMPKENISPKQLTSNPSPKVDRRRRSEPETVLNVVVKQEVEEKLVASLQIKKEEPVEEQKIEHILEVKPWTEPEAVPPLIKEELMIPNVIFPEVIKVEPQPENIVVPIQLSEITPEGSDKSKEVEKVEPELTKESEPAVIKEEKATLEIVADSVSKVKDTNEAMETSRTSTRTTRASSAAAAASESADEKSDSQSENKSQSAKDKKKMTREERKIEAIMKAFERMEKAEQRKLENRDKQSKRRESDPPQSCSLTPTSESKDMLAEHCDDHSQSTLKARRRRKGRTRTTSQTSSNRLNSVDSDMVTSEDEHCSLMSPPRMSVVDHLADIAPLTSEEVQAYQNLQATDIALENSLTRIKADLNSACLLVEAAVGPLETTFKFPKTKKAIMNEWLNKLPEPNLPYGFVNPLEFTNATDNNNSSHPYAEKHPFLGRKSIENLVNVANTMIDSLGGEVITVDSSPEKSCSGDVSEPESFGVAIDSSCSPSSAEPILSFSQKATKRVVRDLSRDSVGFSPERNRTPKKMRKFLRVPMDSGPLKRSLRSSGLASSLDEAGLALDTLEHQHSGLSPPPMPYLPPPPQHSAKKRWLRQAISEESDSPTAESPPNEMVTPLKKRRLARESLEPASFGHSDDAQCPPTLGSTPTKETSSDLSFRQHSNILFPSFEKPPPPETVELHFNLEKTKNICDLASPSEPMQIESSPSVVPSIALPQDKLSSSPIDTEKADNSDCVNNNEDFISNMETEKSEEKENNFTPTDLQDEVLCSDGDKFTKTDTSCFGSLVISDVESKLEIVADEMSNTNDKVYTDSVVGESKSECFSTINSTETSGNSSPVLDEMDDIKKKIHSFHTENIQILKIRNKKQPKEKRKKVNLNFDLSVSADNQTVEVKLKPDEEACKDSEKKEDFSSEVTAESVLASESVDNSNTDLVTEPDEGSVSLQSVPIPSAENTILPGVDMDQSSSQADQPISDLAQKITNTFPSTNLFSESFRINSFTEASNLSNSSASIPDMNVIKNAIDMTTNLETGVFKDGTILNSSDEYKNAQEILSRVNQMHSRNSVLLSGVLKDTNHSVSVEVSTPTKMFLGRANDPRLNPPPVEAPKPVRRKLSISEYRKRHSMAHPTDGSSPPSTPGEGDDEDVSRLEKNLEDSINSLDTFYNINVGVYNGQPSILGRREKLSERLRREFGLSCPDEEEARAPMLMPAGVGAGAGVGEGDTSDEAAGEETSVNLADIRLPGEEVLAQHAPPATSLSPVLLDR